MTSIFLARLRALTRLDDRELAAIAELVSDERTIPGDRYLAEEGDQPQRLHFLIEGWAARVKSLPDGRRHFAALLLPGDLCDVDGMHVRALDYGILTLTPCTVATIDRRALLTACTHHPEIARALTWLTFVDNAILNEAAVSLARRSAQERMVHLLCELMVRLEAIGRMRDGGYDLPLTQEKIADALGLTSVHVNRVMRRLLSDGLIQKCGRRVVAPSWTILRSICAFSPSYLHLDGIRAA